MPIDESEFVRAGLQHYAEALLTLDHFCSRVQARAKHHVASRQAWDGFKPGKSIAQAAHVSWKEPWMAARVTGRLPDGSEARLDLGLWWQKPEEALAFAGFGEKSAEWARTGLAPDPASGIRLVAWPGTNYFVRAVETPELERAWDIVLDELLAAVRRARSG